MKPPSAQQMEQLEQETLQQSFTAFLHHSFVTLNGNQPFHFHWHLQAIGEYLHAVEQGKITRLILNLPPRYLKSLMVSVAWPAWLLGQNPQRRVIACSYSERLALKHSQDCRTLMQTDWYQRAYPESALLKGQNEKHKYLTAQQGFRLAASVGGTLTGEGGDILLLDDPLNPLQAQSRTARDAANNWIEHTLLSRLNNKKTGAIVVVMQRLHAEDVSGFLLQKGGWDHLMLPALNESPSWVGGYLRRQGEALHPKREDESALRRMKQQMGSHVFAAQYQQNPQPKDGQMFKRHWLHYAAPPPEGQGGRVVQSWDTAIKTGTQNDASVCITAKLTENHCYLIDVWRERADYTQLRQAVLDLAARHQPQAILVEDKASGQSLLQDLRRQSALPLIAIMPKRDKLTRFAAITPLFEAGRISLAPRASWLAELEDELLTFPASKHDDQVDSLSQLLNWWQSQHVGQGVRRV